MNPTRRLRAQPGTTSIRNLLKIIQILQIQPVEMAGTTGKHRNGLTVSERCQGTKKERTGAITRRHPACRRCQVGENKRSAGEPELCSGRECTGAVSCPEPVRRCQAAVSEHCEAAENERTGAVSCSQPALRLYQAAENERTDGAE